jgi:hypothetical protein
MFSLVYLLCVWVSLSGGQRITFKAACDIVASGNYVVLSPSKQFLELQIFRRTFLKSGLLKISH